jgi:hypothetical protein
MPPPKRLRDRPLNIADAVELGLLGEDVTTAQTNQFWGSDLNH